jgi:hypothetical protein
MQIKIPKGWRKLKKGTLIRQGDRFLDWRGRWISTRDQGWHVGELNGAIYIRKITK